MGVRRGNKRDYRLLPIGYTSIIVFKDFVFVKGETKKPSCLKIPQKREFDRRLLRGSKPPSQEWRTPSLHDPCNCAPIQKFPSDFRSCRSIES